MAVIQTYRDGRTRGAERTAQAEFGDGSPRAAQVGFQGVPE